MGLRKYQVQTHIVHDSDKVNYPGSKRINIADAKKYNEMGYGIFNTVNVFYLDRKKESLQFINAWYTEMDGGPDKKPKMLEKIKMGLKPTMVVESKNGYHIYFAAKDATVENWRNIIELRILPFYNGDKVAKDLSRILRTPGYYHMKNPSDPFLVRKIISNPVIYTEKDMFAAYKDLGTAKKQKSILNKVRKENPEYNKFWDKVGNINCEYALEKLSGTEHVVSETFSFRENSSGTKQIWVNGKSTSCWIDGNGLIGSLDEGGPTIAQYLNWYHKDYKKVVGIIEKEFPECRQNQMNLL